MRLDLRKMNVQVVLPLNSSHVGLRLHLIMILHLRLTRHAIRPMITITEFRSSNEVVINGNVVVALLASATSNARIMSVISVQVRISHLKNVALNARVIVRVGLNRATMVPELVRVELNASN